MTGETQTKPYSVRALNRQVKNALERTWHDVWLEAEIGSVTRARSGHVYFRLVDIKGDAQMDAVLWRGGASRFGTWVQEGGQVLCRGKITLYELGGRYQFVVSEVCESGEGAKARALAQLKEKLLREGAFDADRKRSLPGYPRCVGVVTSRSGAAVRDIIKVSCRRAPTHLLVAHAAVQGDAAAAEIVAAVRQLSRHPDVEVLIVGRGGGSSEDLDAFNHETVVRAVMDSPVPVVCAVGHEIDVSLAELVADVRAATPSEAAELVVPDARLLAKRVAELEQRIRSATSMNIGRQRTALAVQSNRLAQQDPRMRLRRQAEMLAMYIGRLNRWPVRLRDERAQLENCRQRCVDWARNTVSRGKTDLASSERGLYTWPDPAMAEAKAHLTEARGQLQRWPRLALTSARGRLGELTATLDALSPLASLGRGYAIVASRDGILKNASSVTVGEEIAVRLSRGGVNARVTRVVTEDSPGS